MAIRQIIYSLLNFTRRSGSPVPVEKRISGRTLIVSRWVAVIGQTTAVLAAHFLFGVSKPIFLCLVVIAVSVLVNIVALIESRQRHLTALSASLYLAFDILQLIVQLYLTGGLTNPFFMLLIAPIAVGASILPTMHVLGLLGLALGGSTIIAFFNRPLYWHGQIESMPPLFLMGEIAALAITLVFVCVYMWRLSSENAAHQKAYQAANSALARQRSLTALGAQASAAAHELGSPLSTIAVIARELQRDLGNNEQFRDDIELLLSQTDRCRRILSEFGREPRHDSYFEKAPVADTIIVISGTFQNRREGVEIRVIDNRLQENQRSVLLPQSPEIIHGIGVYLQNALEYARQFVTVLIDGDHVALSLRIIDDGPGFSPGILAKLGKPYVSTRRQSGNNKGLGVFIAETLLFETTARVRYGNIENGGAIVHIMWANGVKQPQTEPTQTIKTVIV